MWRSRRDSKRQRAEAAVDVLEPLVGVTDEGG
jgi:hypothetical protein